MTTSPAEIIKTLEKYHIVPDVLLPAQVSTIKGPLSVIYPGGPTISLGENPERASVQGKPEILFKEAADTDADPDATYTLLMTDPDLMMEHDTFNGELRHWLETGLKIDPTTKKVSGSFHPDLKTDLVAPAPGGSRKHRYVFILAREPKGYTVDLSTKDFTAGDVDLKGRMAFNASKYLNAEGLTVEGVAFMYVEADWQSLKDNIAMTAETVMNKVLGK